MFPPDRPDDWLEMTPHQRHEWRKKNNTNQTGFVGVTEAADGKFTSKIFCPIREKHLHLGTFFTAKLAGDAYESAFSDIYGDEDEWLESPIPKIKVSKTHASWIPYDLKKPKPSKAVLAFFGGQFFVATMIGDRLVDCHKLTQIHPTHWTPMPDFPKQ